MKIILLLPIFIFAAKCETKMPAKTSIALDIQGHRGCRGLMPENSIPGFLKAIEIGVHTLELDVVISKDRHVIVSHEPFFSSEISLDPQGLEISHDVEKTHNIFEMSLAQIQQYDCGTKPHPRFPNQLKTKVYKPTLAEVFDQVEPLLASYNLYDIKYNIEIKRSRDGDGIYHPDVKEFVQLVVRLIQRRGIKERVIIQSFDAETLQLVREIDASITLAWLVENWDGLEKNMATLGFTPAIYAPDFQLVDEQLVEQVHKKEMKIIPWTVNENDDIKRLIELGVDGIISDFPDRVINMSSQKKT